MDIPSLCSICGGLADPPHTCRLCGAVCCSKCFDPKTGTCIRCMEKTF